MIGKLKESHLVEAAEYIKTKTLEQNLNIKPEQIAHVLR
jgi:hypothetical protein